jgi:hypothetical protein
MPTIRHIAAAQASPTSSLTGRFEMCTRALVLATVTTLGLTACASPPPVTAPTTPVVAGGYAPANLADESAKAAQAVAVNEIYARDPTRALVAKVTGEVQVVAGLNYMFTIVMSGGMTYRVAVYRDLQGKMTVTGYDKLT